MYLKSLEITGFKSFGKKAELGFTSNITSIVGPNGSGKSNVAEAFRFVLGEQSIKSLRGKKGEDLIFNGGSSAQRLNRASVKLTFDNREKLLNIDFDEVVLERVVHRDSLNQYFINGNQVRLKDIIELLAGAHIGSSGHHIISQGEADRILNASAKERRTMIEDALGLKIYHYKKVESERKLEKTRENVASVESLRREIKPHITFLKKQVEKVEKAHLMRDELGALYKEYLFRESFYIKHEGQTITHEKAEPERRLHESEKTLSHLRHQIEQSKGKDVKSEEVITLEREMQDIRREKESLSREIGRLEGEISSAERLMKRQHDDAQKSNEKLITLSSVVTLKDHLGSTLSEIEQTEDIGVVRTLVKNVRERFEQFVSEHKEHHVSFGPDMAEEISKLKDIKRSAEEKMSPIDEKENDINTRYKKLREEIDREKDSSRDAEKEMFRILAEQNELQGNIRILEARERALLVVKSDFDRELEEGRVLVGREVFLFETHKPLGSDGQEIGEEALLAEKRGSQDERRKHIEKLKIRLEDMGGGGTSDDVLKEYKEVSERDEFLARELVDLEKSAEALQILIDELHDKLATLFREGVIKINAQFRDFFALMFGGGEASLSVVRPEKKKKVIDPELLEADPTLALEVENEEEPEEGVEIAVNLPRKKVKSLMMLSGGERALTSIALLFAISQVNPPPFIILDETDAALDEANSKKYGDMVENLSKFSQLIVITHNRETMSRAGVLYGVTMGADGASKLLSIAFEEGISFAK